jgi:hypothetical protein
MWESSTATIANPTSSTNEFFTVGFLAGEKQGIGRARGVIP